ncbi:MAG TPA: DUF2155 domain-containing protein [Pseudolabrys sp.]|nr:DUF2155 domain-containing protein [Pseudolabrys sp.]
MARPVPFIPLVAAAMLVVVVPASAQFSDIFSDRPPRPPADVREAPPPLQRQPMPPRGQAEARPDVPPSRPLPAPMALPPSSRPGGGTIQSAPLAPLPGAPVAPQPPPGEQPQQVTPSPTPGLPPGERQPRGVPQQPANTAPQPGDEIVVEPPPQKIANPQAVFAGLDKITGRIIKFDVAIDETVQFGALQVTPRACYTRPPTETPNTDGFVEVDEVTLQGETRRIFTGWMFAASPGLHAVEHPIYDVWLTDCKGAKPDVTAEVPDDAAPKPSPQPNRRTQSQQRRTPQQPVPQRPR